MSAIKIGSTEFANNFYHWYRKWEIRSGTYGDEIKKQFEAGEAVEYDADAHKAMFPIEPLLSTDPKVFRYTDDQIQEIEDLTALGVNELRVSNLKAEFLEDWLQQRTTRNAEIESENVLIKNVRR